MGSSAGSNASHSFPDVLKGILSGAAQKRESGIWPFLQTIVTLVMLYNLLPLIHASMYKYHAMLFKLLKIISSLGGCHIGMPVGTKEISMLNINIGICRRGDALYGPIAEWDIHCQRSV